MAKVGAGKLNHRVACGWVGKASVKRDKGTKERTPGHQK